MKIPFVIFVFCSTSCFGNDKKVNIDNYPFDYFVNFSSLIELKDNVNTTPFSMKISPILTIDRSKEPWVASIIAEDAVSKCKGQMLTNELMFTTLNCYADDKMLVYRSGLSNTLRVTKDMDILIDYYTQEYNQSFNQKALQVFEEESGSKLNYELIEKLDFYSRIPLNGIHDNTGEDITNIRDLKNTSELFKEIKDKGYIDVTVAEAYNVIKVSIMPWVASILIPRNDLVMDSSDVYTCSGGVISNNWMITAAHCRWDDSYKVKHSYSMSFLVEEDMESIKFLGVNTKMSSIEDEIHFSNEDDFKVIRLSDTHINEFLEFSTLNQNVIEGYRLITAVKPDYKPRTMTLMLNAAPTEELKVRCQSDSFENANIYYYSNNGDLCKTDSGGIIFEDESNAAISVVSHKCRRNSPIRYGQVSCRGYSNEVRAQRINETNLLNICNKIKDYKNRGDMDVDVPGFCNG